MRFDWKRFCEDYGVPFVTDGANVSRGNINITCPFCPDPSEHLGLSLDPRAPKWGCWRCKQSGKTPGYLLSRLLGTRTKVDRAIAEQQENNPDDFERMLETDDTMLLPAGIRSTKKLPKGVRSLVTPRSYMMPAIQYLLNRGFDDVDRLIQQYDLCYAVAGDYAQRLVLPVYYQHQLVSWVGRSLAEKSKVRYKTEDSGDLKHLIANYDQLMEGEAKACIVTEGPFDYMKVDFYARRVGVRATCTFGTAWTESQLTLLRRVAKRVPTFVLYDAAAEMEGMILASTLSETSGKQVMTLPLPDEAADPGELTKQQVRRLAEQVQAAALMRRRDD